MRALLLRDLWALKQCAQRDGHTLDMYHFQELAEAVEAREQGKESELADLLLCVKKMALSTEVEAWQRDEYSDLLKAAFKVMRLLLKHGGSQ